MALRPVNSPMKAEEQRRKAAIKEIEENGLHGLVQNMKDAFISVATRFNEIHSILVGVKGDTMALCEYEAKMHRELMPFLGGDISFVVRGDSYVAKDVEDETAFSQALQKIAVKQDKLSAIADCVKLSGLLDKSIESWESKLYKLSLVSTADGSTTSEFDNAQAKLTRIEYTVTQLKIRANTVSEQFFRLTDAVTNRIERYKKEFKPKFTKG